MALKKMKKEIKRNWIYYLMAMPAVVAIFVFSYIPMAGLVMAFQRQDFSKGIFRGQFVGLANFKFLFATQDAWIITRNTILYNVVFIVLGLILAVSLAILMNELTFKRYSKLLQTVYIMPHFFSMVVVSTIVFAFLSPADGFVNSILAEHGKAPVDWYSQRSIWPFLLVAVHLYCHVGYSSIIYMAVISGISVEYYEAAALDGASKLQQALYITIPHLKPIICINLIRSIGGIFRSDFGLFYTVPRNTGVLFPVTNTLDTYIFRGLTELNNVGMSTAAGLYQSLVGFVLVLAANKIISKMDEDCAMF